jgi:hypothetical protein
VITKPAGWTFAKYAYEAARRGDPYPLIARLTLALQASNRPLTDVELHFIRDTLEVSAGKETNTRLRQLEKWLIAAQYDGLIDEDGLIPKNAFEDVKTWRGRGARTVRRAIKQYGKPRRKRRQA